MASWIKMRVDLAEDPAVIAMAARLDIDEDMVVGKLHRLWSWFDQQTIDGNAVGVTPAWVDRRVHLQGFCDAMTAAGWLVVTETGLQLPKFDTHNGETGKARGLTAKRVSKHRSSSNAPCNADTVTESNGTGVTPALPRIDKRERRVREDSSSALTNKRSSTTSTSAPAEPTGQTPVRTSTGVPVTWMEVGEGMKKLKVARIQDAIAAAQANDFAPPAVLALVEYLLELPPGTAESPAGALVDRLRCPDASGWLVDEFWPWSANGSANGAGNGSGSSQGRKDEPYPVGASGLPTAEQEQARTAASLKEFDRLIAAHASRLAAMSTVEIELMIGSSKLGTEGSRKATLQLVTSKGRDSPLVNRTLLEMLDALSRDKGHQEGGDAQ